MEACKQIGRSYHRSETARRVEAVGKILPHVAGVMMDFDWFQKPPICIVDQAGFAPAHGWDLTRNVVTSRLVTMISWSS